MSFFKALFDFTFTEFVTIKIIKFLYILTIFVSALTWLGVLIYSFSLRSAGAVIGAIIFCPIGFFLQVVFARVGYEILFVVFGIADHTRDMAWALTGGRKAPPAAPPAQPQVPPISPQPANPQYPQYPPQPQQPPAATQYPQYPPQQPGK